MAENQENITESASTPASVTDTADTTTEQSSEPFPFESQDGWSDFGKSSDEIVEETAEVPAETTEKVEEKPDETEDEKTVEVSEEDKQLEEIFSDEKDLEALDPEEMIAAQGSRRKKAWAKTNYEQAEIVRDFLNKEKPLTEVMGKFEALNPERYKEFQTEAAHSLVDANPEKTFQRAFVRYMQSKDKNFDWQNAEIPTLQEIANAQNGQSAKPSTNENPDIAALADKLSQTLEFDWRDPANDGEFVDSELAMVKMIRSLEAEKDAVKAENTAKSGEFQQLKKELDELKGGQQNQTKRDLEREMYSVVDEYTQSVKEKFIPHVAKNSGLEITDSDSPEIKAWKERKLELYSGTKQEQAQKAPSFFELYAHNYSSVAKQLDEMHDSIAKIQAKESDARLKGNQADVKKYHDEAADYRIPLMELYAQANKEFRAHYITPDLELIGSLSTSLSKPITEASERIEVVNGGSQTRQPSQETEYETADDIWGNLDTDYAKRQAQRAA